MTDMLTRTSALIAAEGVARPHLGSTESYLHRLCAAAVRALPASGAAVTVMTVDGARGLAIASDPTSQLLADLQVTLGEGPGIDAYALRRPVLESRLNESATARWPNFAPAAVDVGALAAFAFPLQVGGARLGVLDLHRTEAGSLSPVALKQALTFAEVAVLTLLDGQWAIDGGSGPPEVEQAMADQSELYQAQGMVKVQLGVSLREAMSRLRGHAYANDQGLANVAHEVVSRRLRLDRDAQ